MKNIVELERVINQGEESARIFAGLEHIVVELQRELLADQAMAVMNREDLTLSATMVVALDMVVGRLIDRIDTGRRAGRKREERLDG